ncbi:MAG: alkaline phosphatase family protein [Syntrophales bacterium]|nr:alkaline phosphatase family protein [Syntrophales bacterium]
MINKLRHSPQIIIIGLDGAGLETLETFCQQGDLPNIQKLFQEGVAGELTSISPPITPAAWTSFMTGKNPGKHGLFDFVELEDQSYNFRYTNGCSRLSSTLWELLNSAGFRVGLFNIPMTYPPEPLDGFVVAGMDTPDPESNFIHPPRLKDELVHKFGKMELDIRHLGCMTNDAVRYQVLDELKALETRRTDMFLYLLEHHPVDVAMLVFSSSDTVQHYFWHYQDIRHHWHGAVPEHPFATAIKEVYCHLDRQIGRILEAASSETTIIIMSDHGAGATGEYLFYLNRFLNKEGFLSLKDSPKGAQRYYRRTLGVLDRWLRGWLSSAQKAKLAYLFPWLRLRWEAAHSGLDLIAWNKTKAFGIEVLGFPSGIWVNLKGRFPQGIVNPGAEYDSLISNLKSKLLALEVDGRCLIPQIFHRDELFHGPLREQAPDLILNWWQETRIIPKPSFAGGIMGPYWAPAESYNPEQAEWTGTHRLQGILFLKGLPFVPLGRLKNAHILDIAPTICYLLGVPIPDDFDGRVLSQAFTDNYFSSHQLSTQHFAGTTRTKVAATYTVTESEKISLKLKQLGYLD